MSEADRDELVERALGRARFCRDRGEIKTPEIIEALAVRIQAEAATIAGMIKRPISADDVKSICEDWLNADDPTHWGAFEKRLAAALKGGDHDYVSELAERVERATGPDALLGREIAWAVGSAPSVDYTASIDAALSLVPEGWEWKIISHNYARPFAALWRPVRFIETFSDDAATPALALCAAALRAIAAMGEGDVR